MVFSDVDDGDGSVLCDVIDVDSIKKNRIHALRLYGE